MKHTPLTYTLGDDQNPMNGRITDNQGVLILLRSVVTDDADQLMKDIVTACNNHYALVGVLRNLIGYAEDVAAINDERPLSLSDARALLEGLDNG